MGSDPESSCSQYSCLRIYGFLSPDSSHTKPRLFTMFFIISLELFIISLWGLTPVLVMGSDPTVQYKVVAVFLLASKQMPVYSLYSFHRTFIPAFEYLTPSDSLTIAIVVMFFSFAILKAAKVSAVSPD